MKYLNTIILGAFIILLGLFFAVITVKSTSKYDFELSASKMLHKVTEEDQFTGGIYHLSPSRSY